MWQYNYNYLCHSSHKYIKKYWKDGRWVYEYDLNSRADFSADEHSARKKGLRSKGNFNSLLTGMKYSDEKSDEHRKAELDAKRKKALKDAQNAREAAIQKSASTAHKYANQQEADHRKRELDAERQAELLKAQNARERGIARSVDQTKHAEKYKLANTLKSPLPKSLKDLKDKDVKDDMNNKKVEVGAKESNNKAEKATSNNKRSKRSTLDEVQKGREEAINKSIKPHLRENLKEQIRKKEEEAKKLYDKWDGFRVGINLLNPYASKDYEKYYQLQNDIIDLHRNIGKSYGKN